MGDSQSFKRFNLYTVISQISNSATNVFVPLCIVVLHKDEFALLSVPYLVLTISFAINRNVICEQFVYTKRVPHYKRLIFDLGLTCFFVPFALAALGFLWMPNEYWFVLALCSSVNNFQDFLRYLCFEAKKYRYPALADTLWIISICLTVIVVRPAPITILIIWTCCGVLVGVLPLLVKSGIKISDISDPLNGYTFFNKFGFGMAAEIIAVRLLAEFQIILFSLLGAQFSSAVRLANITVGLIGIIVNSMRLFIVTHLNSLEVKTEMIKFLYQKLTLFASTSMSLIVLLSPIPHLVKEAIIACIIAFYTDSLVQVKAIGRRLSDQATSLLKSRIEYTFVYLIGFCACLLVLPQTFAVFSISFGSLLSYWTVRLNYISFSRE